VKKVCKFTLCFLVISLAIENVCYADVGVDPRIYGDIRNSSIVTLLIIAVIIAIVVITSLTIMKRMNVNKTKLSPNMGDAIRAVAGVTFVKVEDPNYTMYFSKDWLFEDSLQNHGTYRFGVDGGEIYIGLNSGRFSFDIGNAGNIFISGVEYKVSGSKSQIE